MSYSFKFSSVLTISQLIEEGDRKASSVGSGGEKATSSSSDRSIVEPVPGSYPCFIPTSKEDQAKEMTSPQFALELVNSKLVNPFKGLVIPGTTKAWSWTQLDIRQPPDRIAYASLKEAKLYDFVKSSLTVYRSNGTRRGLFTRMVTKLTPPKTTVPSETFKRLLTQQSQRFPLAPATVWETSPNTESEYLKKLSSHASPGLPYMFDSKTGESPRLGDSTTFSVTMLDTDESAVVRDKPIAIMRHGLVLAQGLSVFIGSARDPGEAIDNWTKVTNAHPWLKTFVLKRKEERQDRSEFWTKVRPYGVAPLPTKIFCQWAVFPIESRLQNFLQNPESACAYHFSPFYGGATKLVKHFVDRLKTRTSCCITYGDDQLWAFKLADDRVVVIGPDVAAMDMSTVSASAIRLLRWFVTTNPGAPLSAINGIAVWSKLAFHHLLLLGGTQIVEKLQSLISGIAGTTLINFFNSTGIIAIVEDSLGPTPLSELEFCSRLVRAKDEIKRSYNFKFKDFPDSLISLAGLSKVPHRIYKNTDEILSDGLTVPFLSTVFVPVPGEADRRYIPAPVDMYKFGASLICPPRGKSSIDPMISRCERIMGVYYSGGWIHEEFGAYCRETFSKYRATVASATLNDLGEVSSLGEEDLRTLWEDTRESSVRELPSREAMTIFCTRPREELVAFMKAKQEGRLLGREVGVVAGAAAAQSYFGEDQDELDELVQVVRQKRQPASSASSSAARSEEEEEMDELRRMASAAAAPAVPTRVVPPPVPTTVKTVAASRPAPAVDELVRLSTVVAVKPTEYPKRALGHSGANSTSQDLHKAARALERWRLRKQRAILAKAEALNLVGTAGRGKNGVAHQWDKLQRRLDEDSDEESSIAVEVGDVNDAYRYGERESHRAFGVSWADLDDDEDLEYDPKTKKWYHYDPSEPDDWQEFIDDAPSNGGGLGVDE